MNIRTNILTIFVLLFLTAAGLGQATPQRTPTAAELAALKAENARIETQNAGMARALADGNAAFAAKNFAGAIAIFDVAIKDYPGHPALAALATNASVARRLEAVEHYNASVKAPAGTVREAELQLFREGVADADKRARAAVELARDADKNPRLAGDKTHDQMQKALLARVDAASLIARFVARSVSEETHQIFLQYLSYQKNPVEVRTAWLKLARLYSDTGEFQKAVAIYDHMLREAPDNTEALYYAGFSLVSLAERPGLVIAAAHLKKFLALAPATDPNRKDAQDLLDYLSSEGIVPK
ncbi:MAG: tetratricopeptide repeat protein [Chloracidobacterium sp.]|nr:tetratricopeptide repeat protein [Chloracidobacterium sp.]